MTAVAWNGPAADAAAVIAYRVNGLPHETAAEIKKESTFSATWRIVPNGERSLSIALDGYPTAQDALRALQAEFAE